jgi:hypothetical protein
VRGSGKADKFDLSWMLQAKAMMTDATTSAMPAPRFTHDDPQLPGQCHPARKTTTSKANCADSHAQFFARLSCPMGAAGKFVAVPPQRSAQRVPGSREL